MALAWEDASTGSGSKLVTISGTTITYSSEVEFTSGTATSAWVIPLNNVDTFVVAFNDGDGRCRVGTVSTLTPVASSGSLIIHPNTHANTGASIHAGMQ